MAKITYALPSNAVGKNIMYSPLTVPDHLGGAYGGMLPEYMKKQLHHALSRNLAWWDVPAQKLRTTKRGNQLRRCAASRRAGRPSYRARQKQGRLARTRKRV